jgi:GNAT superfamily N-acetyltransferase
MHRSEKVVISYLADRPELVSGLIPGLLEHWADLLPEMTWELREARFREHANRDVLPIAWIAHEGAQAAGTASLRVSDLEGREELTPWLGGVFVRREFRGRGIASALCRAVEARARALRFERLYLFTSDQESLYHRLGWEPMERVAWRGRACQLMIKNLI